MQKLRKSKNNLKDNSDFGERFLFICLAVITAFLIFATPCVVAYGVITGQLDIETLEPVRNEVNYEGN